MGLGVAEVTRFGLIMSGSLVVLIVFQDQSVPMLMWKFLARSPNPPKHFFCYESESEDLCLWEFPVGPFPFSVRSQHAWKTSSVP